MFPTSPLAGSAPSSALRALLLLDASTCLVMGAGLLVLSGGLAGLTGLPGPGLTVAGGLLLPIAAFMAFVGLQPNPPALAVRVVILGNLAWVIASLIVLAALPLTTFGLVLVLAQAAAVAVLAALETRALRSSQRR